MGTNYSGRIISVGDTLYFSKFGTTITSGYASKSGTFGTCYGKVTSLYAASYAFPVVIGGTVTAGTGGTFTTCTVKPADCIKGYQVTVTYSHAGGSGTGSQTGYVGGSLSGSSSRTGYTFAGWYTSSSGGSRVTTIPANAATYYAHWTAKTYTVTFNANGGSGGTTHTETYNSNYILPSNPTRTGYTFAGWYTTASGGSRVTTSTKVTTAGNHTLYAHWTPHTYSVAFNGNGASGSMSSQPFTYGQSQALKANTFDRSPAYKFTSWNKNASGTSTKYTNQQTVSNLTSTNGGTVTLYAQWELQYLAPTITNISAIRTDQNGTAQDDGQYLTIACTCKANTTISSTNKVSNVTVKTKEKTESSWTQLTSVSPNVATYNLTATSASASFDTDTTYDILIEVTDTTGAGFGVTAPQAKAQTFLSKAFFTMDFAAGGEGVGIGMPAPSSGLDVGLNTSFHNQNYVSMRRPYDANAETGLWFQSSMTSITDIGDSRILFGNSTTGQSRGIYLPAKGTQTAASWLIRELYPPSTGTARIEIGDGVSDIRLMGHSSSIGTIISDDGTATLANTTSLTKIADCGTLPAGSWIIFGMVSFASNATGTRAARFYVNGTGSVVGYVAEAAGSGTRVLSFSSPYRVTSSSGSTIEIYARQNSGASMSVTWYYRAMRIA